MLSVWRGSDCIWQFPLGVQHNQTIEDNVLIWFRCVCVLHRWLIGSTFPPWDCALGLSQPEPAASASNMAGYLHDSSSHCTTRSSRWSLPLWEFSCPTLAARGGCAGRFPGVGCCGPSRRLCAAGPVRTPGEDRCPSASSGSPATPLTWRRLG